MKANELKPVTICGIKAVSFAHALSRLVRELGLGMGAHETDRWRIFANTVWPNLFQVGLAEKLRAISDADFLPELEAESLRVATLLADQAKEERLTAPQRDVAPITDTAAWPPDAEWHFRPGQYAYDSKSFDLIGAKWLLLKKLASNLTRHFPLTELRDAACGPDSPTSPTSIRPLLTKLRKILVKNHDLPEDADPIPGDGKGQGAVWWLDMNNRKPLKRPKKKQKQR
ncbi:MAG TPA: hypothetical protein VGX76_06440 [Pirellulales bacterium]|nr:hypothetical protein [Pirellulales bacterium]